MAGQATFNVAAKSDGSVVQFEMVIDGKSVGSAELAAKDVDHLLDLLAHGRSDLTEEVPDDVGDGSSVVPVEDPVWSIPDYREASGRPLFLRHPGFGWMLYVLPDESAEGIVEWLSKDLPTK